MPITVANSARSQGQQIFKYVYLLGEPKTISMITNLNYRFVTGLLININ